MTQTEFYLIKSSVYGNNNFFYGSCNLNCFLIAGKRIMNQANLILKWKVEKEEKKL